MTKLVKIQCVHGLGDHRNKTWQSSWEDSVRNSFPNIEGIELDFDFVDYDDLFAKVELDPLEIRGAVTKLMGSGTAQPFRKRRGSPGDVSDTIHWTAGYLVAWLENETLKKKTRKRILDSVKKYQPDIVLAHSLGSLIAYNAFSHPDASKPEIKRTLKKVNFVALGSQIGNMFVISNLTRGRIEPLDVKYWYHLFNCKDSGFTDSFRVWNMPNYREIATTFNDPEVTGDPCAESYLSHSASITEIWRPIAEETLNPASRVRSLGLKPKTKARARSVVSDSYRHRALLVGINDYPTESDRLEGCLNDCFLMSSVLQECGFPPESIRMCLDDRATGQGIMERLEWLLDDPGPDDIRVFYYSGHGATIPEYGENGEPDQLQETLVPYDFEWSQETAVTDDKIFSLYSQLPYDTKFAMILDCCHSGGMHREGGKRARGLTPPDDIRHRELKWDINNQMWIERTFRPRNPGFSKDKKINARYFGKNGATQKLGRGSRVRNQTEKDWLKELTDNLIFGPYLPLIIEACQEEELSYEYRHGVTSYGAFTYSFAKLLREKKNISFEKLVDEAGSLLEDLGYRQEPQILGPSAVVKSKVPWMKEFQ